MAGLGFNFTGGSSAPDPYHSTKTYNVSSILERGIRPQAGSRDPDEYNRELDGYRPAGYPSRYDSVFMSPGSYDFDSSGDWARVYVDPDVYNPECVIAEMDILQLMPNVNKRGAQKYWDSARVGRLSEVNKLGGSYKIPEIFADSKIPARALYTDDLF